MLRSDIRCFMARFRAVFVFSLKIISGMICSALIVLWIRSYNAAEGVQRAYFSDGSTEIREHADTFWSSTGIVSLSSMDYAWKGSSRSIGREFELALSPGPVWVDIHSKYILADDRRNYKWCGAGSFLLGRIQRETSTERINEWNLECPYWFLVLIFGVWPATNVVFAVTHRAKAERCPDGPICPQCGYDTRATPNHCPECGDELNISERQGPERGS